MSFNTRKIKSNTLGDLLRRTRQSHGWSLKDIERKTGVSVQYLDILETDSFYKLPNSTYARGALKKYSEFLKLDQEKIVKRFEKEFGTIFSRGHADSTKARLSTRAKILKRMSNNFLKNIFSTKIIISLIIILLILFYLGSSIERVLLSPNIEIIAPPDDLVTKEISLIIEGKVERGTEIFINDQLVSQVVDGYFKQRIELLPGLNTIEISAKKKYSKKAIIYRRVILQESSP